MKNFESTIQKENEIKMIPTKTVLGPAEITLDEDILVQKARELKITPERLQRVWINMLQSSVTKDALAEALGEKPKGN